MTNLIPPEFFTIILKVFILFIGFVYIIFAFVVVREVTLMTDSFKTNDKWLFKLLSYIHFFAALGLTALAFLII